MRSNIYTTGTGMHSYLGRAGAYTLGTAAVSLSAPSIAAWRDWTSTSTSQLRWLRPPGGTLRVPSARAVVSASGRETTPARATVAATAAAAAAVTAAGAAAAARQVPIPVRVLAQTQDKTGGVIQGIPGILLLEGKTSRRRPGASRQPLGLIYPGPN